MILRCTARLLALLGGRDLHVADGPPADDDWYANLLWIERRKCLLLTHAGTLFPAFAADVRKPNLRALGPCVTGLVVDALADEGPRPTRSVRSRRRTSALTASRYDEDRVSVNSDVLHVLEPRDALTRSEPNAR